MICVDNCNVGLDLSIGDLGNVPKSFLCVRVTLVVL